MFMLDQYREHIHYFSVWIFYKPHEISIHKNKSCSIPIDSTQTCYNIVYEGHFTPFKMGIICLTRTLMIFWFLQLYTNIFISILHYPYLKVTYHFDPFQSVKSDNLVSVHLYIQSGHLAGFVPLV